MFTKKYLKECGVSKYDIDAYVHYGKVLKSLRDGKGVATQYDCRLEGEKIIITREKFLMCIDITNFPPVVKDRLLAVCDTWYLAR